MIFFFILPSLFTALELQSGSNRPQANAASGNAVITFLLLFFSRETQMQSFVFCEALREQWKRYQALGGNVLTSSFYFFLSYHSKQNDFESWWISFFFLFWLLFWTLTNCIQEDIHIYLRGNKPRFGELLEEKNLWKKTKIHSFFLRKTPSKIKKQIIRTHLKKKKKREREIPWVNSIYFSVPNGGERSYLVRDFNGTTRKRFFHARERDFFLERESFLYQNFFFFWRRMGWERIFYHRGGVRPQGLFVW